MRIAIIGSGISGLVCAHILGRHNEITVFEAADWVGGHTHTVDVEVAGRQYAVDTGFIVFNDWTYPNFIKLMDQLGVGSRPTEMSFSVNEPSSGLEYNGNNLNSLFAQRKNLISPGFLGMVRDILRFNREAARDLDSGVIAADITLGEYLNAKGYGQRFTDHYIIPMGAAIWSMSLADMLAFPLQFFIRFFRNHGLLSVSDRPQWRVIKGGSSAYIEPLTATFRDSIRLNCPVTSIRRDDDGVTVVSPRGEERFDKVILACHSDQALDLLAKPTEQERSILGAIGYADNDVVLHTDTRLLPKRKLAWASWNYRLGKDRQQPAAVTYNMNILQGIESDTTFCVSLNQTEAIDPAKILRRFTYAHPQFSLAAAAAQARWSELAGANHTFFCGAYWANGFHEDGVVSALRVTTALGEGLDNAQ
ncbi:NAD(P)/FAD-dependent oxidoreductase [Halopseudomonas salina]|uniref:Amine oxidase n=1 Tax=Halopseudomonas salina TaxID=1323744 RepID=A0ABQ1Q3G3_9GAMM|nr:FAD-dependent oxidoreductase [Halopseudomonas salina]GGD11555.1 amine oxidase [Halopseudomonas salina]